MVEIRLNERMQHVISHQSCLLISSWNPAGVKLGLDVLGEHCIRALM